MTPRYDIRLTKAYMNANNDIEWFASDVQHIEDTINSNAGEWKENPLDGVGIKNYLSSAGQQATVARKVMLELQKDLYVCDNPIVKYDASGKLTIDPNITL